MHFIDIYIEIINFSPILNSSIQTKYLEKTTIGIRVFLEFDPNVNNITHVNYNFIAKNTYGKDKVEVQIRTKAYEAEPNSDQDWNRTLLIAFGSIMGLLILATVIVVFRLCIKK